MELFLEQIELKDNTLNDNTFDIFYDMNTKLIHAIENEVINPREFVYRLVDTEENIAKYHRQEILNYCLATVLPTLISNTQNAATLKTAAQTTA
jgi:hypothetical protein